MLDVDNPIIRQFLAGKAAGPIGMDEMATEQSDIELELEAAAVARSDRSGADPDKIMTV
jgi:hypothetical protein